MAEEDDATMVNVPLVTQSQTGVASVPLHDIREVENAEDGAMDPMHDYREIENAEDDTVMDIILPDPVNGWRPTKRSMRNVKLKELVSWCKALNIPSSGTLKVVRTRLRQCHNNRTFWSSLGTGVNQRSHKGPQAGKKANSRAKRIEMREADLFNMVEEDPSLQGNVPDASRDTRSHAEIEGFIPWAEWVCAQLPYRPPDDPVRLGLADYPPNYPEHLKTARKPASMQTHFEETRGHLTHLIDRLDIIQTQIVHIGAQHKTAAIPVQAPAGCSTYQDAMDVDNTPSDLPPSTVDGDTLMGPPSPPPSPRTQSSVCAPLPGAQIVPRVLQPATAAVNSARLSASHGNGDGRAFGLLLGCPRPPSVSVYAGGSRDDENSVSVGSNMVTFPSPPPLAAPASTQHTRRITIAGGVEVEFLEKDILQVPIVAYSTRVDTIRVIVDRIVSRWDDTLPSWSGESPLNLGLDDKKYAIATQYWPKVYRTGRHGDPAVWAKIKSRWCDWQRIVEFYRRATPNAFWALFTHETFADGTLKPMSYGALIDQLRKIVGTECMKEVPRIKERYGDSFTTLFVSKGKLMTDNIAIVKRARELEHLGSISSSGASSSSSSSFTT